jgi:superfamily II DNA helicase RecQ
MDGEQHGKGMERKVILDKFKQLKEMYSLNFELKEHQLNIIETILNKKHTMGILATGFGKSMTYIIPPLILDMVSILM